MNRLTHLAIIALLATSAAAPSLAADPPTPSKRTSDGKGVRPGVPLSDAPATYEYTAQTRVRARRQGAVTAGSLTWQCRDTRCTIRGSWTAPSVAACRTLAQQVGEITSYGRTGGELTVAQLQQCNLASVIPGADEARRRIPPVTPRAAGPQPDPPGRASAHTSPIRISPAAPARQSAPPTNTGGPDIAPAGGLQQRAPEGQLAAGNRISHKDLSGPTIIGAPLVTAREITGPNFIGEERQVIPGLIPRR